jgi:hypothetical protein
VGAQPAEPAYSDAGRDTVLTRLATAIQRALAPGSEPSAACKEDGRDWCAGELDGASLDDTWKAFTVWGP